MIIKVNVYPGDSPRKTTVGAWPKERALGLWREWWNMCHGFPPIVRNGCGWCGADQGDAESREKGPTAHSPNCLYLSVARLLNETPR